MPTAAELTIVLEAQDRASAQLRALGQDVQRLEQQVEGVQRRTGRGGGLLGGLQLGAGFAAAQQAFQALGGVLDFVGESIFGLNSRMEQTVVTFEALTGSAGRAAEVVQALRQEAARSPFGDAETLAAGRALITVSDGTTESLLGLVRVAEQLAAIDPAQGLEGAAVALREAAGGEFESLVQRFELSRQSIQRWREQGLTNLQAVRAELERMGVTAALVERLGQTFEGRRSTITSFFDELRQRLGAGVFERIADGFGHMVNLIAQYGDRLRQVASDLGATLGALLERLAGVFVPQLVRLLDALSPGLGTGLAEELTRAVPPVETLARATGQAATAGVDLNRQLSQVGVAAAGLQLEADRVRRAFTDQLDPLQRQLRLLEQSADLQRVQSALATNRATQERLRLDAEIAALQRAAGGATDPNAAGLNSRQRAIALALQERQLRRDELGLEEARRPQIQSLQQQIAALQEQQRQALEPLERQLATYREQTSALQLQRQQAELLRAEAERTAEAVRGIGVGGATTEQVQSSRERGEALADAMLRAYQEWIEANGGSVWAALQKSLQDWWTATGQPAAYALGREIGTTLGGAIGDAVREEFAARVRALFANPTVAGLLGGLLQGASPAGAALPRVASDVAAAGAAVGQQGVTVEFGSGAITIGGINDPGFGERLKAALTDFLQAFVLTGTTVPPGAPAGAQGAGR